MFFLISNHQEFWNFFLPLSFQLRSLPKLFQIDYFFHLVDAAWIADSGRFMDAIKKGELNEVEPVGEAMININSIVDMFV